MATISLSRDQVAALCPECAQKMQLQRVTTLKLHVVDPTGDEAPELKFFRDDGTEVKVHAGFSEGLCKRFGGEEGFFTRCAEAMADKVDDEKAFCASLHKFCVGKWPAEKAHGQGAEEFAARDVELDDGAWRTINGRRVFISKGETPEQAIERSKGPETAKTPEEHRSAMSFHARMAKRAAQAGDKAAAARHDKAVEAHMDAMEKGGHAKDPRASFRAGVKSDEANTTKASRFEAENELREYSNVIKGVEIFATGEHNGDKYTVEDLDQMVAAARELDFRPAIKVGHTKDSPGAPAYGWVRNLRRVGEKLYADFEDMHDSVVDALRNRSYDRVSSEIYFNLKRGGKTFARALKAVALLGAEVPAVASLVPLHKMEFAESGFERLGAFEQKLDVPTEALFATLSERVAGLINLMKENDMAKNAEQIKSLKAQVEEFNAKMDAMMKKKGKMKPEDMGDDEEYKQLAAQAQDISDRIEVLEAEDNDDGAAVAELTRQLTEANAREKTAEGERKALADRLARLEQADRAHRLGERVKTCRVPAYRQPLEALYAYSMDNAAATVKIYTTDKDGKQSATDKSLLEVIDGIVGQINADCEKLFKALAYTGQKPRADGSVDENASDVVATRVKEYRLQHPQVKKYEEAVAAVLAADPDLAQRYRAQFSGAAEQ